MAGWANWNDVQIAASSSVARTVTETLWPRIRELAVQFNWNAGWVDKMLAIVADLVVLIKRSESPILDRDDDLTRAVLAGELFANSNFHPGVLRFENLADAQAWLIRWVHTHQPRGARALPQAVQDRVAAIPALAVLLPGEGGVRPGWGDVNFDDYMNWLYQTREGEDSATTIGNGLIAYVSGMCKLGEMTTGWINTRIRQIRREAQNPDLEMIRAVSVHVWDFYGVAFKPDNNQFGPFFAWIEQQCAAKGMVRLFVTAQQAAEQGCTVINIIADAQRLCDDFNWNRFLNPRTPPEREINRELAIWNRDFTEMKVNPWIRFSGQAGRSPTMANLGYLGKSLLTRALGQTSFQNYGGLDLGNLTIRHRAWIDRIVQEYINHLNRPIEGAEQPVVLAEGQHNRRHPRLFDNIIRAQPAQPNLNAPQYRERIIMQPVALAPAQAQVQNQAQGPAVMLPPQGQPILQAPGVLAGPPAAVGVPVLPVNVPIQMPQNNLQQPAVNVALAPPPGQVLQGQQAGEVVPEGGANAGEAGQDPPINLAEFPGWN